jgi:hypothetical protein
LDGTGAIPIAPVRFLRKVEFPTAGSPASVSCPVRGPSAEAREAVEALHVISYPKAGRTWLRVMLDDVGADAVFFSHDGSEYKHRRPLGDLDADKSRYSGTTVLMVRDPRDAAVSGYFQATRRESIEAGSLSAFLRDDRYGIEKICRFNVQWFAAGHRIDRFAILSYEHMHASAAAALGAVAAFAGIALDATTAEAVAWNRTFERMRAAEASGELAERYGEILRPGDASDPESFKVRRGRVGGYTHYLSQPDLCYCEQVLRGMDYWARLDAAMARWNVTPMSDAAEPPGRGEIAA